MGKLLSYSGISTKIRALQSNLFTEDDYRALASCQKISDAIGYIKRHPGYASLLGDIDEMSLHRGDIEKILMYSLYADYTKIYRFSNMEQRKFLDLYFLRYEIVILKNCLRMVFDHRDVTMNLSAFTDFFDHHSKIDVSALAGCSSVHDMIEALKDTPYFRPLSMISEQDKPTLFDYEMALDVYSFSVIWKSRKKFLSGEGLKAVSDSYGYKIDMLNLQWIYRAKKYFRIPNAEIYTFLIPYQYKLKKSDITGLIEASSPEEASAILKNTYYARRYADIRNEALEDMYHKILNRIHEQDTIRYPYSVAVINSYLYLKEHEIDRLTTGLECIRYGLDTKDILNYMKISS